MNRLLGPPPRVSNSLDLDWGSRVCIFNKFSDDANASGKGPYFEQNCCRSSSLPLMSLLGPWERNRGLGICFMAQPIYIYMVSKGMIQI